MRNADLNIPDGWKRVELKEIGTLQKGITYKSENYCDEDEGYVFINLKCIAKSGGFNPGGIKYYKGDVSESQKIHPGDLFIANTDLTRDGDIVGCPVLLPDLNFRNEITVSMDLSRLDLDAEKVDKIFFYYMLMTPLARKFMKDRSRGSTVLHLQTSLVPTFTFNMPTLVEEQSKVAEILSVVDKAIDKTEALIQKYQHIKQGLMQDLLTKGIDEHGNIRDEKTHKFKDSPLGRISEEWEVIQISKIVEKVIDNRGKTPPLASEGYELIEVNAVSSDSKHPDYKKVEKYVNDQTYSTWFRDGHPIIGDVLIPTVGTVGITAIMGENRGCIAQNIIAVRISSKMEAGFFYYYTSTNFFVQQVNQVLMSAVQPSLKVPHLLRFYIQTPSYPEQQRISSILSQIDEIIETERSHKQKLLGIKRGLMEDLLTGTVGVNHLLGKN